MGVVVGYGRSPSSERAVDVAAEEAARRGVELTVVHALHHHHGAAMSRAESSSALTGQDVAEEGAERARVGHPGLSAHAVSVEGTAPAALGAASTDADLLVVGHRGRGGFAGLRLGDVAVRTVARAGCPAVVVQGASDGTRGVVVAAVDVGDSAEEVLEFAFAEAAQRGARLKVVSALEMLWPFAYAGDHGQLRHASEEVGERADAALQERLRPWREKHSDVVVECELDQGAPSTVLAEATTHADLIVVGGRRRGEHQGMHHGPTATALLHHADCPVAVVPHG
jgi:nucleotide-binding universal stress UspA family protein